MKGVIDFGMGLTLRDGDREYYYTALDRHFPGLKEKYVKTYANACELPSPCGERLRELLCEFCDAHGILRNTDEIFAYLRTLPEEGEQLTLF